MPNVSYDTRHRFKEPAWTLSTPMQLKNDNVLPITSTLQDIKNCLDNTTSGFRCLNDCLAHMYDCDLNTGERVDWYGRMFYKDPQYLVHLYEAITLARFIQDYWKGISGVNNEFSGYVFGKAQDLPDPWNRAGCPFLFIENGNPEKMPTGEYYNQLYIQKNPSDRIDICTLGFRVREKWNDGVGDVVKIAHYAFLCYTGCASAPPFEQPA